MIPAAPGATGVEPGKPRTRGVYATRGRCTVSVAGSSPHTRGLPHQGTLHGQRRRIIPAHAGFTRADGPAGPGQADHPRTRGVYRASHHDPVGLWGSSPHTRGLPHALRLDHDGPRIIPAHAGFTIPGTTPPSTPADHPRTRGVYGRRRTTARGMSGSSPHTRGLHRGGLRHADDARIIPAHAGFTSGVTARPWRWEDHPRTRGVYPGAGGGHRRRVGIIPAHAGFTSAGACTAVRRRIIPAHAGFTRTGPRPR